MRIAFTHSLHCSGCRIDIPSHRISRRREKRSKSHYSIESFQLLLSALEIGCTEPFGEPFINRCEKITCFGALALIGPESGETHCRAQLKQARPLHASQLERLQIVSFRIARVRADQQ